MSGLFRNIKVLESRATSLKFEKSGAFLQRRLLESNTKDQGYPGKGY
ncbi:hypothetical protein [Methanosarcina mazei]|nr:hypothetical protein [Methanosarcina mazei]WIM42091.1 hypothetical protein PSF70_11150 [Methanosarcina mazei]WIM45540.1 hypothetical protein PQQ20_11065 [Methanosarcina mazei]